MTNFEALSIKLTLEALFSAIVLPYHCLLHSTLHKTVV